MASTIATSETATELILPAEKTAELPHAALPDCRELVHARTDGGGGAAIRREKHVDIRTPLGFSVALIGEDIRARNMSALPLVVLVKLSPFLQNARKSSEALDACFVPVDVLEIRFIREQRHEVVELGRIASLAVSTNQIDDGQSVCGFEGCVAHRVCCLSPGGLGVCVTEQFAFARPPAEQGDRRQQRRRGQSHLCSHNATSENVERLITSFCPETSCAGGRSARIWLAGRVSWQWF